jgi:hypothetical protein
MVKPMALLGLLLLLLVSSVFAEDKATRERYLHVSTNPFGSDAYVNTRSPDFSKEPDYRLPAFIPVAPGDSLVRITLFKPEFKDTTLKVTLSDKDTSYLIVSLQPAFSENLLEEQQQQLNKRGHRSLGKRLMLASAVPLLASGIAAGIAAYEIHKAEDCKKVIENSSFTDSKNFKQNQKDFKDYRDNAKTAKKAAITTLVAGGLILSVGVFLSF